MSLALGPDVGPPSGLRRISERAVAMVRRWPMGLRWALPLGWAGFLWYLSALPAGSGDSDLLREYIHNGGHIAAYAILATFWFLALPERGRVYVAPALATAYGLIDELHQAQVVGRACSWGDFLSDACGAVLAVFVIDPLLRGQRWSWPTIWGWVAVCLLMVLVATLSDAA